MLVQRGTLRVGDAIVAGGSFGRVRAMLDEHGEKLSKQTLASAIHTGNAQQTLEKLRKAARHLGLRDLPDGKEISIAEWLLAATQAWDRKIISS